MARHNFAVAATFRHMTILRGNWSPCNSIAAAREAESVEECRKLEQQELLSIDRIPQTTLSIISTRPEPREERASSVVAQHHAA
jgi:hypothetical protein